MIDSEAQAFRVAALPTEYDSARVNALFTRGYEQWNGETAALVGDIEEFGWAALKDQIPDARFIETPGQLAVAATLAALAVLETERYEDTHPVGAQPFLEIQDCYIGTLKRLIREHGDPSIQQDIAEVMYAKPMSESEPYASRICTAVTEKPSLEGPADWYIEIPVAAASPDCVVLEESVDVEDDSEAGQTPPSMAFDGGSRTVQTQWDDNCLYVPLSHLDEQFEEYMRADGQAFLHLYETHWHGLSEKQVEWVVDQESKITERIAEYEDRGQYDRIWKDWEPGAKLVDVLKAAIREGPPEIGLGEPHPARVLYALLEQYAPEERWEEQVLDDIENGRSLAQQIAEHSEHSEIQIEETPRENRYQIGYRGEREDSNSIEIDELEDFFQLPCFAEMDERLQEKSPVRKDLFNFVRMAWWLPQYENANREEFIADIKDLFSRWPWYDPAITERQVDYELRQDGKEAFGGKDPLPMNCDNDSMQRYCIGQHRCPYTIYGAVPFREEMYDQLDEMNSDEPGNTSGDGDGESVEEIPESTSLE